MTAPRSTRQREEILRVFFEAKGPLSVSDVLERAGLRVPGLGIATVYRNLKLLQDSGQLKSVILPSGETRFERVGLAHHHHFQCLNCSEVVDLDFCPVQLPVGTTLPGGYAIEGHEITFYGRCPNCLETRSEAVLTPSV